MAAVEDDKKAKGKGKEDTGLIPRKRTGYELLSADSMDGYFSAVFEQRKDMRDKIDGAMARFSSLTKNEQTELAMNSFVLAYGAYLEPELRQSALAFSTAQFRDSSSIPPKQYEALLKQLWKTTKAAIDESLNTPEAKRLLAPKPAPKK